MKRTVIAMLLTCTILGCSGCENQTVFRDILSEEEELEDTFTEKYKELSKEENVKGDDALRRQCIEMMENTILKEYPKISVNGTSLSSDWTVKDLLETNLADSVTDIEVTVIHRQKESYTYETKKVKADELKDLSAEKVQIKTKEMDVTFAAYGITEEELMELTAEELPISNAILKNQFDYDGIVPGSSVIDVVKKLGTTHWNGKGLTYLCGATLSGFVDFTFEDEKLTQIYFEIE